MIYVTYDPTTGLYTDEHGMTMYEIVIDTVSVPEHHAVLDYFREEHGLINAGEKINKGQDTIGSIIFTMTESERTKFILLFGTHATDHEKIVHISDHWDHIRDKDLCHQYNNDENTIRKTLINREFNDNLKRIEAKYA